MASSEPAAERLTEADLAGCFALSAEAGWNQVAADWRLFFRSGLVWGIRLEGAVVASAALLPYPPETSWISMVLTAGHARGRGFAARLTALALEAGRGRGLAPQLDATPDGERVYRKLGFVTVDALTRWRRPGQLADGDAPALSESERERLQSLDRRALGFARSGLLDDLLGRGPASVSESAFALSRDGRTAHHVGPLVGESRESALAALAAVLERIGPDRSVIIDARDQAPGLAGALQAHGFRPERPFVRMASGPAPALDPGRYFAAAGPEFG